VSHAVQPSTEGKRDYVYLRYVTISQLTKLVGSVVSWWFGLSLASVVIGFVFEMAKSVVVRKTLLNDISTQFWIWLAVAIFSWVLRGQTIPITLPKLSFIEWVLLNLWLGGSAIAHAYLPWWEATPIYWGLLLLGFVYEQLVEMGKTNYESVVPKAEATVEV
jgi:hypothetical protein